MTRRMLEACITHADRNAEVLATDTLADLWLMADTIWEDGRDEVFAYAWQLGFSFSDF